MRPDFLDNLKLGAEAVLVIAAPSLMIIAAIEYWDDLPPGSLRNYAAISGLFLILATTVLSGLKLGEFAVWMTSTWRSDKATSNNACSE